jgi:hypothetical protein
VRGLRTEGFPPVVSNRGLINTGLPEPTARKGEVGPVLLVALEG